MCFFCGKVLTNALKFTHLGKHFRMKKNLMVRFLFFCFGQKGTTFFLIWIVLFLQAAREVNRLCNKKRLDERQDGPEEYPIDVMALIKCFDEIHECVPLAVIRTDKYVYRNYNISKFL